jgi:tetratricopeptide (TPR) repeat protein
VGRESEAAPRIDAAAAADPDVSVTHLAAGLLRLAQERTGEGLLEMERAAALAPDDFETRFLHGIWLLRADLEGSTRQSDSALQALTRASTIRPDSSDVLAWLAYAQMQNRSTLDDAQRSIERAVALAPGRADFRLRWADVRVLQGAYADARQLLSQMAALRTDPRAADGAQERLDRLDEYEQREQRKRDEAAAAVTRIRLRPTQPGEERIGGLLTRVECADGLVRFRLDTGERTIVTGAVPLDSLEMYSYRDAKPLSLACGDQAAPERVYLTVRGAAAVALEFLPPGFTP